MGVCGIPFAGRHYGSPAREREHRPQNSAGVLSLFDSSWKARSPRRRSVLHLLSEVILQAHLVDQSKLGFEEVNVFFLVFQENLEEIG
jgi:hypothetical protein